MSLRYINIYVLIVFKDAHQRVTSYLCRLASPPSMGVRVSPLVSAFAAAAVLASLVLF